MTGLMQGYVWLGLGVALGLCGGFPWGSARRRRTIDRAYEAGKADRNHAIEHRMRQGWRLVMGEDGGPVWRGFYVQEERPKEPEPLPPGTTVYPELAALAAIPAAQDQAWRDMVALGQEIELDVPEPGEAMNAGATSPSRDAAQVAGLGHPSPYAGPLTPAQRRRDKHKHRGQYAPGDLPDPPTDIGAWWQAELTALLEQGQSDWLTRNLEDVAA